MARLKLLPLPAYPYSIRHSIGVRDLNYGNHLSNTATLELVHEARVWFLKQMGANELDLGDGQTGLIQADVQAQYLAEGQLHDDLVVEVGVSEVTERSFKLHGRLRRGETTLALVEATFLPFSYSEKRVGRWPEALHQNLRAVLHEAGAEAR